MIEYALKDVEGNVYNLNGKGVTAELKKSLSQGADIFEFENRIIAKSSLDGAKQIGDKRLVAREFTIYLTRANDDEFEYRLAVNQLLMQLRKARYLVDVTNGIQLAITTGTVEIEYDTGSLKLSSEDSVTFIALSPYWEAVATDKRDSFVVEENETTNFVINNEGFLDVPVYFTCYRLTNFVGDNISLYINSTNQGIVIDDAAWEVGKTLIIDNKKGIVSIDGVNRNVKINAGTGFFKIPPGETILSVSSPNRIEFAMEWQKRYFL